MVSLSFFKKKKLEEIPLPPPPPIEKAEVENEFPEMKPEKEQEEFPVIQEIPEIRPVQQMQEDEEPEQKILRPILKMPTKPLFVSVEDYKKINQNLLILESKFSETNDYIEKLDKIKQEQEKIFTVWLEDLEDVERKITKVDEIIFKHQAIAEVEE